MTVIVTTVSLACDTVLIHTAGNKIGSNIESNIESILNRSAVISSVYDIIVISSYCNKVI